MRAYAAEHGAPETPMTVEEIDAGMKEMSAKFKEGSTGYGAFVYKEGEEA